MMKRLKRPLLMILLTGALVAVGCSENDNPATTDDQITGEDVAVIAEDFSSTLADGDEALLTDWTDIQVSSSASTVSSTAEYITVQDTGQQNRGSLTIERIRIFYDADGNASNRYDPETTVAMDRMLTIEGTRTNRMETRTVTLLHTDSTRITDIAPTDTVRTLNGEGAREVTSSFVSMDSSRTRSFEGNYTWTVSDLQIERGNPYPLTGEVAVTAYRHRIATASDNQREVTVELSFTITFDGTNVAVMTLSDGTVYYIDLDNARLHSTRPTE
ncbi:MAG: hypothetical protein V2A56_09355 [bacterium]